MFLPGLVPLLLIGSAGAEARPASSSRTTAADTTSKTYTPMSDQEYIKLRNPARGFSGHLEAKLSDVSTYFTTASIAELQAEDKYVYQAIFYLDTRVDGTPLSDGELESVDTMLGAIREAGSKAAVRFAYGLTETGPNDPPLASLKHHIEQLTPVIANYSDVVFILQQGFIGAWGEQYYTTNFGDSGVVSDSQQSDRNAVAEAALAMTPPGSFTAMRTPAYKQKLIGNADISVTESTRFTNATGPKIAHFDDCFMTSATDQGTFRGAADLDYVQKESIFSPRHGETCTPPGDQPASAYSCDAARKRLSEERWQFVNNWDPTMVAAWGNCKDELASHLGYRLRLQSMDLTPKGWSSGKIVNTGYASVMQRYKAQLLLLPSAAAEAASPTSLEGYIGDLDIDVRDIQPGATFDLPAAVLCSGSASGVSDLEAFIAISDDTATSDSAPSLTRPAFRILLATRDIQKGADWVATTRIKRIGAAISTLDWCSKAADELHVEEKIFRFQDSVLVW